MELNSDYNVILENLFLSVPIFERISFRRETFAQNVSSKDNLSLLNKIFERRHVDILKNINLKVRSGERIGIVGENGSGKSSLLRVIGGVYPPTSGTVNVNGKIISFIDLIAGMDFEFSGRDNFYFRGLLYGMDLASLLEIEDEVKEYADIGDFFDLPMKSYSTGMQMRLAFALAIHAQGEIILMDEWLSVGDEKFKEKAASSLADLVDSKKTLFIATHSMDLVQQTCHRYIVMENGRIKDVVVI